MGDTGTDARGVVLPLVLGALGLLGVYAFSARVLVGEADVMRHGSGIFDMDVARVVADLTGEGAALRASAHPLQKLLVAPLGSRLDALLSGGREPLAAARFIVAAFTAAGAFGAGWLAYRLTAARSAALAACAVTGASFASVLAAHLPESSALSGLGMLAPLLFLDARRGRRFSLGEAACWGGLAFLGIAFTVTQIVHTGIALGVRGVGVIRSGEIRRVDLAARIALAAALCTLLTWSGVQLQGRVYPGTRPFYTENPWTNERPFMRLASVEAEPLRHAARLASHFLLLDFAAPAPTYSDFLIRDYGLDYWSLSVEEPLLAPWRPAQLALAAAVAAALAAAAATGRWRDPRLVAPGLCLLSQFVLHFLYGREYVLYAPNWHPVLVAVVVAALWNGSAPRWVASAGAASLAAALLANSLYVMNAVYREVEVGLATSVRDLRGQPLPPAGG